MTSTTLLLQTIDLCMCVYCVNTHLCVLTPSGTWGHDVALFIAN